MTKAEARRYVARLAARSLRADVDNGSEWIYATDDRGISMDPTYESRPDADVKRILDAIDTLASELERRAGDR